jgi:hypothetical protein
MSTSPYNGFGIFYKILEQVPLDPPIQTQDEIQRLYSALDQEGKPVFALFQQLDQSSKKFSSPQFNDEKMSILLALFSKLEELGLSEFLNYCARSSFSSIWTFPELRGASEIEQKNLREVVEKSTGPRGVKNVVNCPKCKHNEVVSSNPTFYRADEPAIYKYNCVNCNHVWAN